MFDTRFVATVWRKLTRIQSEGARIVMICGYFLTCFTTVGLSSIWVTNRTQAAQHRQQLFYIMKLNLFSSKKQLLTVNLSLVPTKLEDMRELVHAVLYAWKHQQRNPKQWLHLLNRLTPNDPYMGRTAPLTSKRCILYIYSTNIGIEYFKHALYSPFFSLQNAVCFIMLTCLVPVLFTFYIQGVLKLKKKIPAPKS